MKIKLLILPSFALICVASWFGSERRSASLLENESSALKEAIAARASGSGADAVASKAKSADQLAQEKGPIDWKKIVAQVAEKQSGGGLRSYLRIEERFNALSKEELASTLDKIATGDIPEETRQELQQLLLKSLCEKDPEYALTRYFGLMGEPNAPVSKRLYEALAGWAGKNPVAATAWLDQQIAAGKFESKALESKSLNLYGPGFASVQSQFEDALIVALNSTDPAVALARLKSLPEDQRLRSLAGYGIKDKDLLAYANLIRNGLPEKAQRYAFKYQIQDRIGRGKGYTEVTEFLNSIQATPAERAVSVEQVAAYKILVLSQTKTPTLEEIDSLRTWATSQALGVTDKATGSALAMATQISNLEFSEAAALATHYHEASGNDDVLSSFLASCQPGPRHEKQAAVLAAKISDVKKREEVLSRFK